MTNVSTTRLSALPTGVERLRLFLRLDAVVTGVNGLAYLVLAGPLADLLGTPAPALRAIGAFLAVFGVAVWLVAAREHPPRPAVSAVIEANAAWVVASVVVLVLGTFSPTTVGAVWIALQAVTVGLFAALQFGARDA